MNDMMMIQIMDILINYIRAMNIMMMSLMIYTYYHILQQQQPEHNINADTAVGSSSHLLLKGKHYQTLPVQTTPTCYYFVTTVYNINITTTST